MATDATYGYELWSTDGTEAGTEIYYDLNPGTGNGLDSEIAPTYINANIMYIHGTNGVTGRELYKLQVSGASISENNQAAQFTIFPNPADDFVQLNGAEMGNQVRIIDISGKVIHTLTVQQTVEQINVADFAPGIYFLMIENQYSQKLIIK